MNHHMPSDLIPVQNDMIISFVNYELRVRLEAKEPAVHQSQIEQQNAFFSQVDQEYEALAAQSTIVAAPIMTSAQPLGHVYKSSHDEEAEARAIAEA
jgi:hypothetical protein